MRRAAAGGPARAAGGRAADGAVSDRPLPGRRRDASEIERAANGEINGEINGETDGEPRPSPRASPRARAKAAPLISCGLDGCAAGAGSGRRAGAGRTAAGRSALITVE